MTENLVRIVNHAIKYVIRKLKQFCGSKTFYYFFFFLMNLNILCIKKYIYMTIINVYTCVYTILYASDIEQIFILLYSV